MRFWKLPQGIALRFFRPLGIGYVRSGKIISLNKG